MSWHQRRPSSGRTEPLNSLSLFVCVGVAHPHRESLLVEMGVSIKEDGGTLGVFSPKGVSFNIHCCHDDHHQACKKTKHIQEVTLNVDHVSE